MTRGEWLMLATVGVLLVLWILAARSAWMPRRPLCRSLDLLLSGVLT